MNFLLLHIKLHRPQTTADLISRPRLFERLERGWNRKLTLICAPAGYGKSTLAAAYMAACPRPAAWLSLDETDSDLYRFLTYVAAAIQTIFPDGCAQTLSLLQAPQNPPLEHLTATLINEIAAFDEPFMLMLDDYHQIRQAAIHQFMDGLIDHMPTLMHLVIISREIPPLSIPRLRANREIQEIGPYDLRFSLAEAGAFLAQFLGAPMPVRLVEMLVERTEGWIVGLRLAALSLRGQTDVEGFVESFHGTNRYIMEYLVDEILMRQPQAIQEFLLQTSILNRLCGPLCDALTGQHDPAGKGQAYLEQLQRANFLIVPLDQENHWYRYHALLRDLLRHKLMAEANPQQVAALHARAAAWLADNGLVEEALLHLLAAGDPLGAAQLVESQRHRLLDQDNWRILDRWLALLPAELLQKRPGLLMARAQVLLLFTHNLRAIPSLVQAAERLLSEPATPLSQDEALLVGVELDVIKGCLECLQGQAARSFDHLQRALFRIPPEYGHLRGTAVMYFCVAAQMTGQGDIALQAAAALQDEVAAEGMLTVRLLAAQLLNFLLDGQVPKFIQLTEYALKLSEQYNYVNLVANGHFLLGHGYYLLNNLEVAAFHLAQAVELRYHQHIRLAVDALALLALTHQAMQQPAQAKKTIELLLDFAQQNENMAILAVAHSGRARIALQQGDIEAATRWLQTADITLDSGAMLQMAELPRLTYCRVLIAQNTAAARREAIEKLQAHLKTAEDTHNTLQIIQILSLQSLAYYAQGQVETALAALKRAVTLAQPGGFIRNFVDCGPAMAGLLRQLAGQGVAPDYIRQILAAFPDLRLTTLAPERSAGVDDLRLEDKEIVNRTYPEGASSEIANRKSKIVNLIEPLTDRELEILELLARRLSNQEIARSLDISILTVKSHTTHIYQKLNVKSRYQAIAKARALNLLPPDDNK